MVEPFRVSAILMDLMITNVSHLEVSATASLMSSEECVRAVRLVSMDFLNAKLVTVHRLQSAIK